VALEAPEDAEFQNLGNWWRSARLGDPIQHFKIYVNEEHDFKKIMESSGFQSLKQHQQPKIMPAQGPWQVVKVRKWGTMPGLKTLKKPGG